MSTNQVLIVDDEKNIRLTVAKALESINLQADTAINGEEALQKLVINRYRLIFLDLKMPGISGLETLTKIRAQWPDTRVVMITAHGTIDAAVEAMKMGAADFLQKPFSPSEIRDAAARLVNSGNPGNDEKLDYPQLINQIRNEISIREYETAGIKARKAISVDPSRPEAYNLVGALLEIKGEWIDAQKFYRAARDIDPSYQPACRNLNRATSWNKEGIIDLGASDSSEKD